MKTSATITRKQRYGDRTAKDKEFCQKKEDSFDLLCFHLFLTSSANIEYSCKPAAECVGEYARLRPGNIAIITRHKGNRMRSDIYYGDDRLTITRCTLDAISNHLRDSCFSVLHPKSIEVLGLHSLAKEQLSLNSHSDSTCKVKTTRGREDSKAGEGY